MLALYSRTELDGFRSHITPHRPSPEPSSSAAGSAERNAAVLNLYLQCYTQEEIAGLVGIKQPRVNELLSVIRKYEIPIIPAVAMPWRRISL